MLKSWFSQTTETETENNLDIKAETESIFKQYGEAYLFGFSSGVMFLINRKTLVPICAISFNLDAKSYIVYANRVVLDPSDYIVISDLITRYNAATDEMLMAYHIGDNQILLNEEAEAYLASKNLDTLTYINENKPEYLN